MFPLNILFATTDGHIGYHMNGLFPKRKYKVAQGVYPKKGWLKENQWEGFVDPKDHPRLYDPEQGFIASANNFATTQNSKWGISHAFTFSHRFLRISEIIRDKIATKGKLDTDDMKDIQLDTLDI